MLGKSSFQIVQREENLEQSVLTGLSTAVFAIPGVDVGDEVSFTATIAERDPTLGEKVFGLIQLPTVDIGGIFRTRVLQEKEGSLAWGTSPDLTPSQVASEKELIVTLDNPKSSNFPQGAPGRFGMGRIVEWSSFSDWAQVSSTFWNHFNQASVIPKDSPLLAEIANLANASNDPAVRARAALKLVQDRVRYVFVGLETGNYTPAPAALTWERRYGDCKGKTALLLAILKELAIPAEAVLVNQAGLDGIESRLPSPGLFDHVLVRAIINGKAYWLDGTQLVSPKLDNISPPAFRTGLPLRSAGSVLETIRPTSIDLPMLLEVVEIDATQGIDQPSHIKTRRIMHGPDVVQYRAGLAALAGDDLNRTIRGFMQYSENARNGEETSWAFDEDSGSLTMNWKATQKLDWENDDGTVWTYIPGAGFNPPDKLERPLEQDQKAPWAVEQPYFKCYITTIRLPKDQGRLRWTYSAKRVNRVLGGMEYYRLASIKGGVVQTIMSRRAVATELSPEEAKTLNSAIPDFDNAKSYIYQTKVGADAGNTDDNRSILDADSIDWGAAGPICRKPKSE